MFIFSGMYRLLLNWNVVWDVWPFKEFLEEIMPFVTDSSFIVHMFSLSPSLPPSLSLSLSLSLFPFLPIYILIWPVTKVGIGILPGQVSSLTWGVYLFTQHWLVWLCLLASVYPPPIILAAVVSIVRIAYYVHNACTYAVTLWLLKVGPQCCCDFVPVWLIPATWLQRDVMTWGHTSTTHTYTYVYAYTTSTTPLCSVLYCYVIRH